MCEAYKINSYVAFQTSRVLSVLPPNASLFFSCPFHPYLFVTFKSFHFVCEPLSFTWAVFMTGILEITTGA